MLAETTLTVKPMELLEYLSSCSFLDSYGLMVHCSESGRIIRLGPESHVCGELGACLQCGELCRGVIEKAVNYSLGRNKPVVFRCRAGLLNFAVPLRFNGVMSCCLVGGGLREQQVDLVLMESLAKSRGIDAFALLEKLDRMPAASLTEVKQTAAKVYGIISSLGKETLHSRLLDKTSDLLNVVTAVSDQLVTIDNVEESLQLLTEALAILFDLSKIAVVMQNDHKSGFSVAMKYGLTDQINFLQPDEMSDLFPKDFRETILLTGKEMHCLFPGSECDSVHCIPIQRGGELFGFVALFDAELHQRDMRLVELLAGRFSTRLMPSGKGNESRSADPLAGKLLARLDLVCRSKSKEDLYQHILETAADLLQACSGSFMVVDENSGHLRIESSIGLNPRITKNMKLEIGAGISGKVAATGEPMLVDDIEDDPRVGTRNRYRFKTKSFVSVPLKVNGAVVGVLNLSDKQNGNSFSKDDLDLLSSILNQAAMTLERALSQEKVDMLEEMSMTDPITGLFNSRFAELNLDRELNRSGRNGEKLAVMLVDLDNFSAYNNLCGHAAGDKTLKITALLLKALLRQMDTVTRGPGGQFRITLPGVSRHESLIVAERIRNKIESTAFPRQETLPAGCLTACIGISLFPENGDDSVKLLQAARLALDNAKSSGHNKVAHFTPETKESGKVISLHTISRQR